MAPVDELIAEHHVRALTTDAIYAAGEALAGSGAVDLVDAGPMEITADVTEGAYGIWRARLASGALGLEWACDCPDGASGAFCMHLVAAAVRFWRASPGGG